MGAGVSCAQMWSWERKHQREVTLVPSSRAARQREAGGEGRVSDTMLSTQEGLGDTESVFIVPRPVEKGEGPALEFKA